MKLHFFLFSISTLVFFITIANAQSSPHSQQSSRTIARENDTVWVIVNPVKADKRAQFEKFINEVFWPGAKKLSVKEQQVFTQTRVLYPTKQEADGSYNYMFIMDQVITGGDYDIESLLKKIYGEPKANEYIQMYNETTAAPQIMYSEVQSRY